jgi:hypothetical protein
LPFIVWVLFRPQTNSSTGSKKRSHVNVTTIQTVREIDAEAKLKGITISPGKPHKFRTSYATPFVTELSSAPKVLTFGDGDEGDLFADVVSTRVYRALRDWQGVLSETWDSVDFEQVNWRELFWTFQVEIGRFLAIDPRSFAEITRNDLPREDMEALGTAYREFSEFEGQLRELLGVQREDNVQTDEVILPEARRHRTMAITVKKLGPYEHLLESPEWPRLPVPRPETTHAIAIPDEMNLSFASAADEMSETEFSDSLDRVMFQAI